jgi:short-subunit dehydrogenase
VSCQAAVDEFIKREVRLDVLVNNAAYELVGAHEELSMAELRDQVDVNFFGAVHMMKATTPFMLAQRTGSILNISSIGSDVGWAFNGAYSAGKFALRGYSEAIGRELLPFNIFVSLISPAGVTSGTTHLSVQRSGQTHPLFAAASKAVFDFSHSGGDIKMASSTEAAAKAVHKTITAHRSVFMYRVGFILKLMTTLKAILPQKMFEAFYMKAMKVPTAPPPN